jgi:hypothetical protein
MQEVDAWFDGLMKRGEGEDEAAYWKRFRNGVKSKRIESYRNGKKAKLRLHGGGRSLQRTALRALPC